MATHVTILAAGMGTRLGRPLPKSLTILNDGRTIMKQQHDNIFTAFDDAKVMVVVGFKLESIIEEFPGDVFIYNELFDQTNTSKSLLKALKAHDDSGVVWMNGDVVYSTEVLKRVAPLVEADQSFVIVDTAEVSDEEVKYTVDADGFIKELSKQVPSNVALGEAVGINFVSSKDKPALIKRLEEVDDQDYFERGIELAIADDGAQFKPVDISDLYAVEVDFPEDLDRANQHV